MISSARLEAISSSDIRSTLTSGLLAVKPPRQTSLVLIDRRGKRLYSPVQYDGQRSGRSKTYSMFCTCSRICSIATFISTPMVVSSSAADFDPKVLASRCNS